MPQNLKFDRCFRQLATSTSVYVNGIFIHVLLAEAQNRTVLEDWVRDWSCLMKQLRSCWREKSFAADKQLQNDSAEHCLNKGSGTGLLIKCVSTDQDQNGLGTNPYPYSFVTCKSCKNTSVPPVNTIPFITSQLVSQFLRFYCRNVVSCSGFGARCTDLIWYVGLQMHHVHPFLS